MKRKEKPKSPWLVGLWLLWSLIAPGCIPAPTYDEMSAQYDALPAGETKEELGKRLWEFERRADEAEAFYTYRQQCIDHPETVWVCEGQRGFDPAIRGFDSIDTLVRAYRRDNKSCGCGNRQRILGQ